MYNRELGMATDVRAVARHRLARAPFVGAVARGWWSSGSIVARGSTWAPPSPARRTSGDASESSLGLSWLVGCWL